jgi:hypothetical protein
MLARAMNNIEFGSSQEVQVSIERKNELIDRLMAIKEALGGSFPATKSGTKTLPVLRQPLVQSNGDVVPETFSVDDINELKGMGITIG